jgi:ATP-dependent protease HslVU (ClpYQ) peptidase subunit
MCWFLKGEDKPCNVEGEFEILIVTADGDLLSFNGSMTDPCVLGRQKYAMGSGKDFALAAMDSGLNSHDAVLVAAKRDIYTSTNVVTFQIIKQEERF